MGDLPHRDVIACSYIVDGKTFFGTLRRKEDGFDDVPDVDVGLALGTIAEDAQFAGILQ